MQAPRYTRNNAFSQDERNNVGGRSSVRTDQVDDELDDVSKSINAVIDNQNKLQRDDGGLRDQVVQLYNLTPTARAALQTKANPRGMWQTGTAYTFNDLIDLGGTAYLCAIAHTSTVFIADQAAGRWSIFIPTTSAAGSPFSPTPTIAATNVQDAVVEVNAKLRAGTNPQLAAFFGGL